MASSVMSSVIQLKPSLFTQKSQAKGLPSLARTTTFKVNASGIKKIKTKTPFGQYSIYTSS